MKKILESKILLVVISVFMSTAINVIATTSILSSQVSYSNNKTSETTVKGAVDELFSAVDINERLGSTNINNIGNGTVTGAISTLNSSVNNSVSKINSDLSQRPTIQQLLNMNLNSGYDENFTCVRWDPVKMMPYIVIDGFPHHFTIID